MAVGETANTTTISMLPENAENLEAHALLDFLHDHSWDQGHVAVADLRRDGLDALRGLVRHSSTRLVRAVLGLHAPDPNHNTVARHVVSIM